MALFQPTVAAPGVKGESGRSPDELVAELVRRGAKVLFLKNSTYDSTLFSWASKKYEPAWGAQTISVTTDGGGNGAITFPVAFNVACLAVVMSPMSTTLCRLTGMSVTGFTFIGPVATFDVSYFAVGI